MTAAEQYLPVILDRIFKGFDPEKIILFGSLARGDITWDIDVDLLVVLAQVGNKREKAIEIRGAFLLYERA
jgi:predicted nucleotidyltransferase